MLNKYFPKFQPKIAQSDRIEPGYADFVSTVFCSPVPCWNDWLRRPPLSFPLRSCYDKSFTVWALPEKEVLRKKRYLIRDRLPRLGISYHLARELNGHARGIHAMILCRYQNIGREYQPWAGNFPLRYHLDLPVDPLIHYSFCG